MFCWNFLLTYNNSNTNINYLSTGIIDTSTFGQSGGCEDSNYANPGHPSDENSYVLMIESSEDAYYTYTTKSTSKLTANNYYKIVVKVKTNSVCQNDENSKVLIAGSKTNYHPFGASIAIDGIDAKFTGIDTNGEWKDYTIYVNCTTDAEVKILLSLGDINAYTSGAVYYSSATITTLTSEEYTSGIAVLENDAPDNIMAIGNTDIEEQEETTSNSVNFDWLLVPSIITAVAILVAVVGTIIRKTKKASKKQTAVKPYSKENIKKLKENYKNSITDINKQINEINKQQNDIAVKINKLKEDNYEGKKIDELKKSYKENNLKIEKLKENIVSLKNEHQRTLESLQSEKQQSKKTK